MAKYSTTDPIIVIMRSELEKNVSTYREHFALRDSGKPVTTYSRAIALPLVDDEQDIIDGIGEFVIEHESIDIEDSRKAVVFSHIAKQLEEASKFFKDLAEDWAHYVPKSEERLTDNELKALAHDCYKLFQQIIDWTGDPNATGQEYSEKQGEKGGYLLGIPRIKASKAKAGNATATSFQLYVNERLMNSEGQEPYMSHAMREAFGSRFKSSELLEMMKEQGITLQTTEETVFTLPDGTEHGVRFAPIV